MSKSTTKSTTRPIDMVRQSYASARRSIVIPEWAGLELFFFPLTTADQEAIEARMRDEEGLIPEDRSLDKRIYLVIAKAQLEDGTPAFKFGEFGYLKKEADFLVLNRVVTAMYSASMPMHDSEAAKKKLEETPTSDSG